MGTASIPDLSKELSFENFWAGLQASLQESDQKFNKRMKESDERFEKDMKESDEKFDARMKRLDEKLGRLGNRIGDIIEDMIDPGLLAKFQALGFTFSKLSRNINLWHNNRILTEVDALLENGDKVMVVEVKSKPSSEDIQYLFQSMGKVRFYADNRGDKRRYFGAVGGMYFDARVRNYALKKGFYVIEPSGEAFNIIVPEGKYQPREW